MPQFGDDIFLGPALGPNAGFGSDGNPAPMSQGVGPMGRVFVWDVVPLTLQAAGLAAAQAVGAAGNLALTAGTGVTRITLPSGSFSYVLDCARCVTLVSANAGDTTQTATVSGFDYLGAPMTSRVTLNGVTTVVTSKAFKQVTQIAISAATAGNISAGFNDRLGIPLRVTDVGYVQNVKWSATLAADAGTFVAAVTTDPATVLTGDVRGLYTPSSAANGARRLVMTIAVPGIGCGPQATRIGAFGVTQV